MSAQLQHSQSCASHRASAIVVFPLLIKYLYPFNRYCKDTEYEVQRTKVTCPKLTHLPSNQKEKSPEIQRQSKALLNGSLLPGYKTNTWMNYTRIILHVSSSLNLAVICNLLNSLLHLLIKIWLILLPHLCSLLFKMFVVIRSIVSKRI